MAVAAQRGALRLEQREEEKGMCGQLQRSRFTRRSRHSYAHSAGDQTREVVGIKSIAAVIRLANLVNPINLMQTSSRHRVQHLAGFDEGARETVYYRLRS